MLRQPQSPTLRLAALAALLAMCVRLLLPLLHGGHDCHHHASPGGTQVEVCSCGMVHTDAGDVAPTGEHQEDDGEPCSTCLACQLEDQSPGGDPLAVVAVPARPIAPPTAPSVVDETDVLATCVRPPPRAPPERTI